MKQLIYIKLILPFLISFTFFSACKKDSTGPEINKAPQLLSETLVTAIADSAFVYQLETSDPEGEMVQVSILDKPAWLNYADNTQTFSGTPRRDDAGLNRLNIQLSDGLNTIEREIQISVIVVRSFAEQLQESLQTAFENLTPGLAGVSVAVSTPENELTTAWTGSSHYAQPKPIEATSQYRVASISKTFTAALILRMVEEGYLELDAPFSNYLPIDGLEYGDQITIRQLLSHTGGVFDHLNSNVFWNDPNNYSTKVWNNSEIFQFAVDAGAYFEPGTGYAYSNTGFYILGAIAEKVLSESLAKIFNTWIFDPLGLENTFYDDYSMIGVPIQNLAESQRAYDYHLSAAGAAGAIVSTPTDIAKFGKALYGGDFLQSEHVEAMLINIGGPLGGSDYGLGTRLWDDLGINHYGHTGSLMDYRNILMYVPGKSVAIAVHTNDVHENWFDLVNQILLTTVNAF